MDSLLPQLLAFPPHPPPTAPLSEGEYDKKIRELVKTLHNVPGNKLIAGVSGGRDLLEVISVCIFFYTWLRTHR